MGDYSWWFIRASSTVKRRDFVTNLVAHLNSLSWGFKERKKTNQNSCHGNICRKNKQTEATTFRRQSIWSRDAR